LIKPFGLRQIGLMYHLQRSSCSLDVQTNLLEEPWTPLHQALRGYILKPTAGVCTYVMHTSEHQRALQGFVQARTRQAGLPWMGRRCSAAVDIVRIAPDLDFSEDAGTVWYRLLLHLCVAAGEAGTQRLFARLPEDTLAEDVFRQAGFAVYCRERVFGWSGRPYPTHPASPVRSVTAEDQWEIQKLWRSLTPARVLSAEEPNGQPASPPAIDVHFSESEQGYVLRREEGDVAGFVHMLRRPRGIWLRLLVSPEARHAADALLDHVLITLGEQGNRPIYCAVRDYEDNIESPLQQRGFEHVSSHSLWVKQTAVQVKENRPRLVHAVGKRAEVAPTISHSGTKDH